MFAACLDATVVSECIYLGGEDSLTACSSSSSSSSPSREERARTFKSVWKCLCGDVVSHVKEEEQEEGRLHRLEKIVVGLVVVGSFFLAGGSVGLCKLPLRDRCARWSKEPPSFLGKDKRLSVFLVFFGRNTLLERERELRRTNSSRPKRSVSFLRTSSLSLWRLSRKNLVCAQHVGRSGYTRCVLLSFSRVYEAVARSLSLSLLSRLIHPDCKNCTFRKKENLKPHT